MPTITRQQIKQVENGMRRRMGIAGYGGLGDATVTLPGWQLPTPIGSVGATPTNQSISLQQILGLISGQAGQLKVEATQFAEGMVKLMYGLEPSCAMPPRDVPVVAGANPPKFCGGSVAGAIERCRLTEASASLAYVDRQLQTRAAEATTTGPLIRNWYNQYGRNDVSSLNGVILASRSVCGAVGTLPKVCQLGFHWDFARLQCVPDGAGDGGVVGSGEGISTNTIMMIAAAGLVAIFLMKR